MKARLNTSRTLPFFDSLAEVADVNLLTVQVLDASGTEVGVLAMTQVVNSPNLFLSATITPITLGQYQLYYKYDGTAIFHDTMEVGPNPISDFPIGVSVNIIVDDDLVGGGAGQSISARIYSSAGASTSSASFATHTGTQAITTFPVNNNDVLTIQVTPDTNVTGAQTVTFLCASAEVVGAVGNYGVGGAGDTATYQIDGGVSRAIDLNGVAGNQAAYTAALNAQLKGAYAVDNGGGVTKIVTDSLGSGSVVILSNFGGSFQANTGLAAGTYPSTPGSNNISNSDAVTFAELKLLIETGIMDAAQGDRITATLETGTNFLVLTATSGTAGSASTIDLQAGTAALVTALGLGGLGTLGGAAAAVGNDGVTIVATYSATFNGYVITHTFSTAQEAYVVWYRTGVQTLMVPYLVTQEDDKEVVLITAGSLSGSNNTPHIGTTIVASTTAGVQVAQGDTDVDGEIRLEMSPGEYVFSLTKPGHVYTTNNFTHEVYDSRVNAADPNLYTVAGATDVQAMQLITEVFEPTVTTAPAPADMCTLFATLYHMDGTPVRHATVHVGLVHRAQLFTGTAVFDTQRTFKTDSNGYVEFSLVQGIQVDISIAPLSLRRRITVPSAVGPTNLMTLLSGADDPFDILTPNIVTAPKRTL